MKYLRCKYFFHFLLFALYQNLDTKIILPHDVSFSAKCSYSLPESEIQGDNSFNELLIVKQKYLKLSKTKY